MRDTIERKINTKEFRIALGKESFFGFLIAYFPQLFKFNIANFHKRWYKLLSFFDKEENTFFTYLVLLAFRESAKTTLAKIKIVRDICYKRKKLIGYVCYEKEKSGEALFDTLDTDEKKPEKRTINNFVTNNGVRVAAYSIRQSVRGRVFNMDRPDCYVIDDFENNITKKSGLMTRRCIEFLRELMAGLAAGAEVIFLCNRVSDCGSVQWLLDLAHNNPAFRVSEVAAIEKGKSTWKSKLALTDEEAKRRNQFKKDVSTFVKSLESLRRTMNADGSKTFEQEMLNQAQTEGDRFFDVAKIDERIKVLQNTTWQDQDPLKPNYQKKEGDWIRWGIFKKGNRNTVAADVAEGFGNDSSTIQDFDLTESFQVAEYESNRCEPSVLGQMMVIEGKLGGYCLLIPERNSIGIGTIQEIKSLDYINIHREKSTDKITNKTTQKFGWHTNGKSKPIMLFDFKRDFEAGLITINSIPLLREMRAFSNNDVTYSNFDPEASNHFDRLMAICIAWQARNIQQVKGYIT